MIGLVVLTSMIFTFACANDPCSIAKTNALQREHFRGTNCDYRTRNNKTASTSDRNILEEWYSITDNNGHHLSMATSPVERFKCSTKYPIWMNGSHPGVTDGIVDRTACERGITHVCIKTYQIEVKNCTTHYVYKLAEPNGLEKAYCFGDGVGCPPIDPCEDLDRIEDLKDDGYRDAECTPNDLCDANLKSGWRRITSADGKTTLTLTGECPLPDQCGAKFPAWINDTTPRVEDGIVIQKVCIRNATTCCAENISIQTKNCSSFMVYKLQKLDKCPQRYCFGNIDTKRSTGCYNTDSNNASTATNIIRYEGELVTYSAILLVFHQLFLAVLKMT